MDVPSLMRQAMSFNRERTAIITEHETLTFAQMWDRGVRLANGLRELGIRPGDRVAGLEDNNLGAADFFLGAAIAGAVRVPLYPRNSAESHAHMVEHTGARVVLSDVAYADSVAAMDSMIPGVEHVVIRDSGYEQWLKEQSDVDPMVEVEPDDWYIIRHSAGTTGRAKGVGYTQQDWLVNCRNWFYRLPKLRWGSVVGHAGPISHASGYLFLPTWLHGSANLLFGEFESAKVLDMLQSHRVTHMFTPPSMVQMLAADASARERELPELECILVGGAPITDATARAGRDTFGDVLYQVFGQTEAVPLTIMTPEEWFGDVSGSTPMRAAGRVFPFVRLETRDAEGVRLPLGVEGELYAQVESQMRGFWEDDELTDARIVDGWIRTRDIGRIDENGFVYILDRVDDMIVSGGFNIWPAELETVINDHPEVIEVAVFSVPHERWGETPMAVCQVKPGAKVTVEEIVELVRERLGSYKKPTRVEFTNDPLPKNVVGKLLRKALREPYWSGQEKRVSGA
ncbi:class I adenylate-forming enzyme family protein [Rhodococcus jostii]|uniref:class I adenylate-forming enzyme family protein n=1 Tax=Rhodococcus jostii TaxID=132919 RepID=UPI003666AEC7